MTRRLASVAALTLLFVAVYCVPPTPPATVGRGAAPAVAPRRASSLSMKAASVPIVKVIPRASPVAPYPATTAYVSPTGVWGNTGTITQPRSLGWAFGPLVAPDGVIDLRGGTYDVDALLSFNTVYSGGGIGHTLIIRAHELCAPYSLCQDFSFSIERATITRGDKGGQGTLFLGQYGNVGYFRLQDLEVTSSANAQRITAVAGSNPPGTEIRYGEGIGVRQDLGDIPGVELINDIVHDTRQGLSLWQQAVSANVYGLLSYNNGWSSTADQDHGHGVYSQSKSSGDYKRVADSIIFGNRGRCIQLYGSSAVSLNNFTLDGNALFSCGEPSITITGSGVAKSNTVTNNSVWGAFDVGGSGWPVGSVSGDHYNGNYLAGRFFQTNLAIPSGFDFSSNTVVDDDQYPWQGYQRTDLPNNSWSAKTGYTGPDYVIIKPNQYDASRCRIDVFNFSDASSVLVDIGLGGIPLGAPYRIQYAKDYYGAGVVQGIYDGTKVAIPMQNLHEAPPAGNLPVVATAAPTFATFIVLSGAPQPVTPSPTFTPTPTATTSPSATSTPTATSTSTPVPPTATAVPPTATAAPPTATAVPPSPTPTDTPTSTPQPTSTNSPTIAAPTVTATQTPTRTWTPTRTPTRSPTPNDHTRICNLEKKAGVGPCGAP